MKTSRLPWLIGVGAALFYLSFHSAWYNFDGVACAIAVELGNLKRLAHGNHLAYGVLGLTWDRLWRLLGYAGPALIPLQAMNQLLGGAGVGVFASILLRLGVPARTALAACAGLTLSYAWWFWSLEAQVYPLGAFFMLLAAREAFAEKPRPAVLGLLHAGAVLGHAGHALLTPCALYLLAGAPGARKRIAVYLASLAAAVLAAYALAAVFMIKPKSLEDVRLWLLGSALLSPDRSFRWQGGHSLHGLAWWIPMTARIFANPPDPSGAARALGWVLGWTPVAAAAVGWARLPRRLGRSLMLWLAGYALLFTSWNPYVIVYRVSDLAPFWLILALAAAKGRGARVGLVVWALAAGLYNWSFGIRPHLDPSANGPLQEALWIKEAAPENAWVCATSNGEVYLPYFGHRKPLILHYYDGRPEALRARLQEIALAGEEVYATQETLDIAPAGPVLRAYGLEESARKDGRVLYRLKEKESPRAKGRRN